MRDLLSKAMTGSMIAGAALLVAACGGGEDATANNAMNYSADDALMNDVTAVDAMNGGDANLGLDANMTTNTSVTDMTVNTTTTTDMNAGTTNTTGM